METTHVILSNRVWNRDLAVRLENRLGSRFILFDDDTIDLYPLLETEDPDWIFVPHWSKEIDSRIWKRWTVVIFHMTDLPFGRGGSPLQNLIVRGFQETMMSAIQCVDGLDEGSVYLKSPLSLQGSAEQIYVEADRVIEDMVVEIVENKPHPTPQTGRVEVFTRKNPSDSELVDTSPLATWFDQIRMLDAPGYPKAFIKIKNKKLSFEHAELVANQLVAKVIITQEE